MKRRMGSRRPGFGLLIALAVGVGSSARGQDATPAKMLAYDVVSIKANKSDSGNMMWNSTPDGIRMENVTLRMLVGSAFNLRSPNDDQVSGLPKWGDDEHFDVEAKVSDEDLEAFRKLKYDQQGPLLLAALEDRFKLKAHKETRELPIYSMVIGKGGLKIKPEQEGDSKDKPGKSGTWTISVNGGTFHGEFQGITMEMLAANLSFQVHRQVKNDTGLAGKYDLKLDWSLDDAKDPALPGIFTALQDQTGLKLVPSKGPVECVVVEHVEEPTEN